MIRVPKLIKVGKASDTKKAINKEENSKKLPPDVYKPIISGKEIEVSDTKKLCFSVTRRGDDGLPHVDIREYISTELYTGMTKKGVNFDIEYLDEVIEMLQAINKECEKQGV